MLKNYRPILLQDLDLEVGGVRVLRLRLNQHTPEAQWSAHAHEHSQLLIYLSGRGAQTVAGRTFSARAGTVIYVEPGTPHAFEKQQVRQPLCLVVDLELKAARWPCHVCTQLAQADLSQVRAAVGRLFSVRNVEQREMILLAGATVLEILHVALQTVGWLRPVNRFGDNRRLATTRMVERALERYEGSELSLDEVAGRIGYQHDYLNRLLKAECGLTLGQLRARQRVRKAQALLQMPHLAIHEVAEQVGILDHNYFSRWFRQQTGVTPTRWRRNPTPLDPL